MSRPKGARRINVNDIVGTNIGMFKIIAYKGDKQYQKKNGVIQIYPKYEVECNACGTRYIKRRDAIKSTGCRNCASMKLRELFTGSTMKQSSIEKGIKSHFKNKQANKNSISKIKYYSSRIDENGRMIHICKVGFKVNEKIKTFTVYSGLSENRAKELAMQAQQILSMKTKEEFIEWYNKIKEENKMRMRRKQIGKS